MSSSGRLCVSNNGAGGRVFTHTQLHLAADLHRRASQQEAGRHSNGGRVHNSPKAGFIAAPAEGINGKSLGRKKKGGGGGAGYTIRQSAAI